MAKTKKRVQVKGKHGKSAESPKPHTRSMIGVVG